MEGFNLDDVRSGDVIVSICDVVTARIQLDCTRR